MPEDEYLDTTLRMLYYRIEGFFELEDRREKGHWERVRWQSALVLNMFAKKGQQIKPKQLVTFPWETDQAIIKPLPRVLTREEQREKFAKYDQLMQKKWAKAD